MVMEDSGNVGIGTTEPSAKLDIDASGSGVTPFHVYDSSTNYVADFQSADDTVAIQVRDNDTTGFFGAGNSYVYIGGAGDLSASNLNVNTSTGNVGIGTTSPSHLLELSGGAYCDGSGDWISGSDIVYKKDIEAMNEYGLDEILQLNPVKYVHKQDGTGQVQLGFIAQEVKPVIPEVVDGEEGHMGIGYGRIIPVLVNAIKELTEQKNTLEQRLDVLEAQLNIR